MLGRQAVAATRALDLPAALGTALANLCNAQLVAGHTEDARATAAQALPVLRCNETAGLLFTHLAVPVMTRLRQPERLVLDTLVAAGVARSRSEALAWSVRLVGRNAEEWLGELRQAMEQVERVREQGPDRTQD